MKNIFIIGVILSLIMSTQNLVFLALAIFSFIIYHLEKKHEEIMIKFERLNND